MSRRDLRPLPEAAAKRVELATARHEIKINDAILAWHDAGPANIRRGRALSAEQQSQLQDLLVEMAVRLGGVEGREYLNTTSSPHQFQIEVAQLMAAIAIETCERLELLSRDFHIDPQCQLDLQVREALKPAARRLIRDAWSVHEKRLEAECACSSPENGNATPHTGATEPPAARPHRELVAQKIDQLRIDKGLSVEELAVEAGLDRKTVAGLIHGQRAVRINTIKKLADALGVKASDLTA
jgi:DNA-binding Xre family transcriptional regulator